MVPYNVDAAPKRRIKYHLTKAEVLLSFFTDMASGPALSELKDPDCGQFGHGPTDP